MIWLEEASLLRWRNERMPRLAEVDAQCAASLALVPARPNLAEENLRGYVLCTQYAVPHMLERGGGAKADHLRGARRVELATGLPVAS